MVVELGKRESEGEARGSEDRRWWKREETIGVWDEGERGESVAARGRVGGLLV